MATKTLSMRGEGTMARVDVNTLTMEQYLALSRENQAPGMVKPEIRASLAYSIFPKSLKTQSCSEFFPLLLPEPQRDGWIDSPQELSILGISSKRPLSKGIAHLPRPRSRLKIFPTSSKKETDHYTWERYNDLLYKCPTHDINSHQKVNIFYKGLSTMNRQLLDSQGPIPGMTLAQALTAIQTMVDHSQKWHDGTTSRNIGSSSSKDGLAAFVGCQICEGPHLDKDCPLNEEVKQVEEVRYGEFRRTTPFNGNNRGKFHVGPPGYYTKTDNHPPYGERRQSLEELLAKHQEESA
ncbi:hypothetical protein Tco_1152928 [Tanacetum coccineum]